MAKTEEEKAAEKALKEKEKREALTAELATFNVTPSGDETLNELNEMLKKAKADAKAAEKALKEKEKREALTAELATFNVTPSGDETLNELNEMLKKAKADAKAASNKPKVTSILVKFRSFAGVETERTFSQEVHGDGFEKLAKSFTEKHAPRVIEVIQG